MSPATLPSPPLPDSRAPLVEAPGLWRTSYDRVALVSVLAFFVVHPFHHLIFSQVVFYREAFAAWFALLSCGYLSVPGRRGLLGSPEVLLVALWVLFVLVAFVADPGVTIYPGDHTGASEQLGRFSPRAYVLRTALLYLPLLLLITARGLNPAELKRLLWVIVALAPISIVSNYIASGLTEWESALEFSVQRGLSYNSFVPYITFPLLGALFLYAKSESSPGRRASMVTSALLLLFLFLNPSRQSILFAILALGAFGLMASRTRTTMIVIVSSILIGIIIQGSGLTGRIAERFFTGASLETPRWVIMSEGLALMRTPSDWLFGHGLSSVVVSGPHNNFIRLMQRIGLPGMVLGYLPFLYALFRVLGNRVGPKGSAPLDPYLTWLLAGGLVFTLYHSLFGYPQDDAWQAPYVWLGLGMVLALRTDRIRMARLSQDAQGTLE